MRSFARGERIKLSDLTSETKLKVTLNLGNLEADLSCFGLDGAGKLSDDRYFIFFNQLFSPEGAISASGDLSSGKATFSLNLSKLPSSIEKLTFAATLDTGMLSSLSSGFLSLSDSSGEKARFEFRGSDFGTQRAVMIVDLYLKNVWRFSAVGQGFKGGLQSLLEHFGGQALEESPVSLPAPTTLQTNKVVLHKSGDAVQIALQGQNHKFHVNLNWNQSGAKLFGLISLGSSDIDLGCLYVTMLGSEGVIQPLGYLFGSSTMYPYIHLDQDDRTGQNADGENLYFEKPQEVRRAVIYAYVYRSLSGFKNISAKVKIFDFLGNEITVFLDNPSSNLTCCAVAIIGYDGSTMRVQKEERYFQSQDVMSQYYNFELQWQPGTKGE